MSCYAIVETIGVFGGSSLTSEHVATTFAGRLSHSTASQWLKTEQPSLYALVLRSYRMAVKMVYDRAVMMELDTVMSDSSIPELLTAISELTAGTSEEQAASVAGGDGTASGWHIGPANDSEWNAAVARGQRNCFAMGKANPSDSKSHSAAAASAYTTLTLSVQNNQSIAVGRLTPSTVRSLWASAALELLYFANGDDERYSIQTQPILSRNLCVQTAEPPLGYPVFSSQPIIVQS